MSRCIRFTLSARALLFALALSSSCAHALDAAGHIEFATGKVVVVDRAQQSRSAEKGAALNEGDTVMTNEGRAQLRFSDGGHFSLQPNTHFRVDEYRYAGNDDGGDHVFLSLLKGGLRTISGLIGKHNPPAYRLNAAVATIGIRGTEYALDLNSTLYGHVTRGAIEVCNGAGCISVPSGKAFFVSSPKLRPVLTPKRAMLAPPDHVVPAGAAPVRSDQASGAAGLTTGTGGAVATTTQKSYSADAGDTDFVLKDPKAALAVSAAGTGAASQGATTTTADKPALAVNNSAASSSAAASSAAASSAASPTDSSVQPASAQASTQTAATQRTNSAQAANAAGNAQGLGPVSNQQVGQVGNQQGGVSIGAPVGNSPGLGKAANLQIGQLGTQQIPSSVVIRSIDDDTSDILSTASQLLGAKIKKPKKAK
jgi:hypothetical protein